MVRLALRQFLRSSFDPGDKTMASPIIACLGAATLLILASCSFVPITATDLEDYSNDDISDDSIEATRRVLPLQSTVGNEGFVRTYNYDGAISNLPQKPQQAAGIGSRSLRGRGGIRRPGGNGSKDILKNKLKERPKEKPKKKTDYLNMMSDQGLLIVDILAKELDKGLKKIADHADKHENGAINVPSETPMGKSAGLWAQKYLRNFLRNRWVGILSHIAQEAVDRLIAASEHFFTKTKIGKLLN